MPYRLRRDGQCLIFVHLIIRVVMNAFTLFNQHLHSVCYNLDAVLSTIEILAPLILQEV